MRIEFNERAFQHIVDSTLKDVASEHNQAFASLTRQYRGKPVSTIKPLIKRQLEKYGGTISNKELTEYAQMVSDGSQITFHS